MNLTQSENDFSCFLGGTIFLFLEGENYFFGNDFFLRTIFLLTGVILAVLEKMSLLPEFYSEGHEAKNGTVSAGYQNFLICIEMFFGALALKHAFPHHVSCWIESTRVSFSSHLDLPGMFQQW